MAGQDTLAWRAFRAASSMCRSASGSPGDSRSRPGHHVAVRLVGRVRLVVLEPGRELVGVPQDLLNAARHRRHLKSFSGARVACTITTADGFRYAWRVVDPRDACFGRFSPGSDPHGVPLGVRQRRAGVSCRLGESVIHGQRPGGTGRSSAA
jgi:hypothetical protein